jgi:UDP:flavonoid glycosyltransferase YjiC (YdhE family)
MVKSSSRYDSILSSEGVNTFHCEEFDPDYVLACVKKFNFRWLNESDVKRVFNDQVRCILEHQPEFVIGDTAPTLKMAAEYTGTRFISLINGYISKYYALTRPMPSTHPAAFLKKIIPPDIFNKILVKMERKAFESIHRPFKMVRTQYKLRRMDDYLDELQGDFTFLCDDEKVFPQQPLPQNYKIIGPIFYAPPGKYMDLSGLGDPKKKSILVSFGSSGEWKKVNWLNDPAFETYNVFVAGEQKTLKGPHIHSLGFVDLACILPQVNLIICHGGNGTLNQSYQNNIPFIAFPSILEQEWNAARFQELGAGRMLNKKKSATEMDALIKKMLT